MRSLLVKDDTNERPGLARGLRAKHYGEGMGRDGSAAHAALLAGQQDLIVPGPESGIRGAAESR